MEPGGKVTHRELAVRATLGLARVALARANPESALKLSGRLPEADPRVQELRGEAHAALAEKDDAGHDAHLTAAQSALRRAAEGGRRAATGCARAPHGRRRSVRAAASPT